MSPITQTDVSTTVLKTEKSAEKSFPSNRQDIASVGKNVPVEIDNNEDKKAETATVKDALADVEKFIKEQMSSRELDFAIDEDSEKFVITVSNSATGELIRQIPSKEMMEIAKHIQNIQTEQSMPDLSGLLIKEDA